MHSCFVPCPFHHGLSKPSPHRNALSISSSYPLRRLRTFPATSSNSSNSPSKKWTSHKSFHHHYQQQPHPYNSIDENRNIYDDNHTSNNIMDTNENKIVTNIREITLSSQSKPTPGREDEFSDSNGDSLQGDQSRNEKSRSKVTTLDKDFSFDTVLQELSAIQQDGPRNVAILGTRHTSYLHQQIIELLTYANVLVGNHVFTSGAGGTNAAVIKGALRAERPDLLTVVLPQSLHKQPKDTQEQLKKVSNLVEMDRNDPLPLDVASQLCNSDILSRCTHFIAFAFHDSDVVLEAVRQAKELRIVVTVLYLD